MAYYTGKDVDVWVTTEHPYDFIEVNGDTGLLQVNRGTSSAGAAKSSLAVMSGGLTAAGVTGNKLTDISGCDVSIGAVDEDISFFGLRNVGKIEVKKETSVTITRKKSDNKNMQLFQGQTSTATYSSLSTQSYSDGKHSGRWGLTENAGGTAMVVSDGTVDPKSAKDDASPAKQSYGWRVFIELKADSTGTAGDGAVLVIPNCTMMEYSSSVSNESANEETFTFSSMVKPIIYDGDTSGTNSSYATPAVDQTATSLM